MGLTCSCGDGDWEPGMTIWYDAKDYTTLATKRPRKCCSCGEKIEVGAMCAEVPRFKVPESDVEVRIYGEDGEVPRAPAHLCERCADIAFSLDDLGYCMQPWEDQRELVAEYAEMHQKVPNAELSGLEQGREAPLATGRARTPGSAAVDNGERT